MEQNNTGYKLLKIYVIILTVCNIIALSVLLWYTPAPHPDPNAYAFAKEERKALQDQREAINRFLEEKNKSDVEALQRDSTLRNEIIINRNEIKKVKALSYEKIRDINNYKSADIVRAFANLKDD